MQVTGALHGSIFHHLSDEDMARAGGGGGIDGGVSSSVHEAPMDIETQVSLKREGT